MPHITYSRKRAHNTAFAASTDASNLPSKAVPLKDQKITSLFAPRSSATHNEAPEPNRKRARLTQMTIDLGANPRRKCKECGMEYIPSNVDDAKMHVKYHARQLSGIEAPASLLANAKTVMRQRRKSTASSITNQSAASKRSAGIIEDDVVLEVTRRDGAQARGVAQRLLEAAEADLGAIRTASEKLWSQVTDRRGQKHDRYKMYIYVHDGYCVGLCLAEMIASGRAVLATAGDRGLPTPPPSSPTEGIGAHANKEDKDSLTSVRAPAIVSSSIQVSNERHPAIMGVSRIWVSREVRGHGMASEMLSIARTFFTCGRKVRKEEVAFSQPTESGLKLARKWFKRIDGWLMYDDG